MAPHFLLSNPVIKESNGTTLLITMNGLDFIKSKQQSWAKRKKIKSTRRYNSQQRRENYLYSLADNLFEPLSKENLDSYNSGDGNLKQK